MQDNPWPSTPEISSASACFNQTGISSKFEEFRVLNKYEELLDKVVFELKGVNKNINSVHSRLSAVEANMSEISMQVSVSDSKLQAADILVTMENFEKKWQTLKPWLVSLESTPAKSNGEISNGEKEISKSFDKTFESDEIKTSLPVISLMSTSSLSSVLPLKETKSSPNVKPCQPSLLFNSLSTSINNIGDSNTNSNQSSDYQNEMDVSASAQGTPSLSSPINVEDSSNNSNKSSDYQEKTKLKVIESSTTNTDKNTQKCEDTSDVSSTFSSNKTSMNNPEVPDKSVELLENKTNVNNTSHCKASLPQSVTKFYSDLFFNSRKEKSYTSSDLNSFNEPRTSSALQTTNNLEAVQNSNEGGDCKTVTPSDNTSSKEKSSEIYEPEHLIQIKQENADIEKEYVIVQTKDIEGATQHEVRDVLSSTGPLSPSSIDEDFQVCSNLTEYLEVNLGQNKDETYKFAFTTKSETPEFSCPLFSPLSNCIKDVTVKSETPEISYPLFSPLSNRIKDVITKSETQEASYPLFSPFSNDRKNENELKISLSIKDDSFNTFFSDLKRKNSLENKQSSPLVVTENKNSTGCQLLIQKSGINKS